MEVFITIGIVSATVLLWWFFVLLPRMEKYVKGNTQHVASASVEVRHTQEPRLRPERILVISQLPEPSMEAVARRIKGSVQQIADADTVIAIDRDGTGYVVKDRDGYGPDGYEVEALVHRVING